MVKIFLVLLVISISYNEAVAGKKPCCKGPNESYEVRATCIPDTCSVITARYDCTKVPPLGPGCYCDPGYYRPAVGEDCVEICDCPQMKYSPDCTPVVDKQCHEDPK